MKRLPVNFSEVLCRCVISRIVADGAHEFYPFNLMHSAEIFALTLRIPRKRPRPTCAIVNKSKDLFKYI